MRYRYLNLIRELAISDFKVKYQGSILGYFWSLAKPLAFFSILLVVFTKFVRIGSGVANYPLLLLVGIVLWSYFAESTVIAMNSVVAKQDMLRKVYFPRSIIALSSSITTLITFLLNFLVIFVFMYFSHVSFTWHTPLIILPIIELYLLSLGISFFLSSLFVKFRDMGPIWELFLQALFYATPILYPLSLIPKRFQAFVALSPTTQIIQDARKILIDVKTTSTIDLVKFPLSLVPYVFVVLFVVAGWYYYQHASQQFAEEV